MYIDDRLIERCDEDCVIDIWQPQHSIVVLGRSNVASQECYLERCERDGIDVLQRYGGGGCVLLHPGCAVVGLGTWVRQYYSNDLYFRAINAALIDALAMGWPILKDLAQDGLSDIVWGAKKIAGTSLFRSRNYLLYQASILVRNDIDAIERYLCHPSKEPEYRGKRTHRDFLADLHSLVCCDVEEVLSCLSAHFHRCLINRLEQELLSAQQSQVVHVKQKISRG